MTGHDLPLLEGTAGEAVRDLQRRLSGAGFDPGSGEPGRFGPLTLAALTRFQESRGLRSDGRCGLQTWAALVEAGYRLGDRLLYERRPMVRGDDVVDLQTQLGRLGFDAGRVDGIFGPQTTNALVDFQRNAGLTTDGICGPDTIRGLDRLGRRAAGQPTRAAVRERDALLHAPRRLQGRRIMLGETGGLAALAAALERALHDAGAVAVVSHQPDGSDQADEANRFGAELYLGLHLADRRSCTCAYYRTPSFESLGGRLLAEMLVAEIPSAIAIAAGQTVGMRVPVLRETRMPAVLCEIGPPALVVQRSAAVAGAARQALSRWVTAPIET